MELFSITKGNFNLNKTKETYRHENNLRFHVRDENRKFYEFSINSWNKNTINLRCVNDRKQKCSMKLTLSLREHLKTQEKIYTNEKPFSCSKCDKNSASHVI